MLYRHLFLIVVALLAAGEVKAQLERRQISLGSEYNILIDNNKWIFGDAFSYHASFTQGKKPKKKIANWYGFAVSYMNQKAVADTLYYIISETEYGYSVYGNRTVIQVMARYCWETAGKNPFGIQAGIDIGFHLESYSSEDNYPGVHSSEDVGAKGAAVTPFLGIKYGGDKGVGFYVRGRYQFVFATQIWNSISFGAGATLLF